MAARSVFLQVVVLFCLLSLCHVSAQGPTTLSISFPDSFVTPREGGGATGFGLTFNPPQTATSGTIDANVISCGSAGLPSNVAIANTSITSTPAVYTVSANTSRGFAGAVTITNIVLSVTTPPFPVNQTDGSYSVEISNGTLFIGRVNGTLTGRPLDFSNKQFSFSNPPSLPVTGNFKALPGGTLSMSASLNLQVLISQIVAAAGFSGSQLTASDTSGGAIRLVTSLLASGPDPCK
ncbi:hypothetical protein KFL_001840160 [Klebsormidium nitens]|uniref:Uncharacterized protein n=1 Tax=Klebsormidium nitens TaxID=105231 RepID=A0A1Y1I6H4_KLENI|nr:hypothetical protein KFL_001840160 [Klebsormidium nitens]|eukprot:GAQ84317.1 hypothetical protein KFL_001840160 [Klebsormidium nitens]